MPSREWRMRFRRRQPDAGLLPSRLLDPSRAQSVTSSIRHDLGDTEQDHRGKEKQIDVGFDLTVAAQHADILDGLLAQRRLRAALGDQRDETARFGLQLLDALVEVE